MPNRSYQWSELPHLAKRAMQSLRKPVVKVEDDRWLRSLLSPEEALLYRSMSGVDRAHAIECARKVDDLGPVVVVASALHDVGKTQSGLGTAGRVLATLCGLMLSDRARTWKTQGLRGQIGTYLDHTELGAAALAAAGASDTAVTWAREHHLDPEQWTLPADIAALLAAADK